MGLNAEIARSHLETLIEDLLGVPKAQVHPAGHYEMMFRDVVFTAHLLGLERPIIRLSAVLLRDLEHSAEVMSALNDINGELRFLRTLWSEREVLLEGDLLALSAERVEFEMLCNLLAEAAHEFGSSLGAAFGGAKAYEFARGDDDDSVELPGYL